MKTRMYLAVVTVLALGCPLVADANPDLFVHEGFQYTVGDKLHQKPADPIAAGETNAIGLAGQWLDQTGITGDDFVIVSNSLVFGDLPTTGHHVAPVTRNNNDIHVRSMTESLAGLQEIWFSILAEKIANNYNNGQGGLVIGNQAVNNSQINADTGSTGLMGFGMGPTTAGTNWKPYAWSGTNQIAGDAALTVGVGNGDVHLFVGHISFNSGTDSKDEFTLYDYELNAGSIEGGTLNAIASTIEVDVDESLLDTLSLTRHVETAYDEIRIGRTLSAVTGGPPPPPAGTVIVIK